MNNVNLLIGVVVAVIVLGFVIGAVAPMRKEKRDIYDMLREIPLDEPIGDMTICESLSFRHSIYALRFSPLATSDIITKMAELGCGLNLAYSDNNDAMYPTSNVARDPFAFGSNYSKAPGGSNVLSNFMFDKSDTYNNVALYPTSNVGF